MVTSMITTPLNFSAKSSLKCTHHNDVLACSTCTDLLPSSFWERMAWNRFSQEPNTYHVTMLTNCLAKAYFDHTNQVQESVESAWAKLRGSLLHYMTRSLGWSELRVKMKFQLDGQTITIVGHVDAFDPETATVYDLKTTRFVNWQDEKGFIPRENHVAQVQCYNTLLDLYGIPVNRLVLVYVDDKNIVAKQVPMGNRKEWMIQRAILLRRAFAEAQLPEPEPSSSCKYCPHVNICPQGSSVVQLAEAVR